MENSSKALLIAAAVLIAILIVTISLKILTPTEGVVKDAEEIGETMSGASQGAVDKLQSSLGTSTGNKEKILIGDKVAYDEGSKETTIGNKEFTTEDLDWRVLSIESNGTVNLISTQPTSSKLKLSGEEGYLNAETTLKNFCNKLYGNEEKKIEARSLKVEDIDKLAGINTDADKRALDSQYGKLSRYKYNVSNIYYQESTDNGATWSNYEKTSRTQFKEPGKDEINSTNYQVVSEQKYTFYSYNIADKVTQTTADGISMADLMTKGINSGNNAISSSHKTQWLSSRCVLCYSAYAYFELRYINFNGSVHGFTVWRSDGDDDTGECPIRPVVSIPASALGSKVNGVWQVNI